MRSASFVVGSFFLLVALSLLATEPARSPKIVVEIDGGESLAVPIELADSASPRSGLGIAVSFNSRELEFIGVRDLGDPALLAVSGTPELDVLDLDGSPETDTLVRIAWIDTSGRWRPQGILGRLAFARKNSGMSAGVPEAGSLTGSPERIGREGRVAVRSTVIPVVNIEPSLRSRTQSPAAAWQPCSLDIDGNGKLDGSTDGILVLRYLLGFTDASLTSGAIGTGASRTTPDQVSGFLSGSDCSAMLDGDGNRGRDALTDGLLIARHLFGFTGEALISNAVAQNARRTEAVDVISFLQAYGNEREALIDASLTTGQEIKDSLEEMKVKAIDGPVRVQIVTGFDSDRNRRLDLYLEGSGKAEISLPSTGSLGAPPFRNGPTPEAAGPYPWGNPTKKWFVNLSNLDRLPEVSQGRVTVPASCASQPSMSEMDASRLLSDCMFGDKPCYEKKEPVVFVHGFKKGGGLGDAAATYGQLPARMKEAGYVPFYFNWDTRARFEDVAVDLGAAVRTITGATGREVHIVAHSMGGIVSRTLLQGLATTNQGSVSALVRTLTTLGSPHSGLASKAGCSNGTLLPRGRDDLTWIWACNQVSCHELGERTLSSCEASVLQVESEAGGLVGRLAAGTIPQNLDVLVLLGWLSVDGAYFNPGDGLISYYGQRFKPSLTMGGTCSSASVQIGDLLSGKITEKGLAGETFTRIDPRPGSSSPSGCSGDRVSGFSWQCGFAHFVNYVPPIHAGYLLEANVPCAKNSGCTHPAFLEVKAWVSSHVAGDEGLNGMFAVKVATKEIGTSTALQDVLVEFADETGSRLPGSVATDSGGVAQVLVPFFPKRKYLLILSRRGYFPLTDEFTSEEKATTGPLDLGIRYMTPRTLSGKGDFEVTVKDLSGQPVSGAKVALWLTSTYSGSESADREGTTSASGVFSATGLINGTYRVEVSRTCYQTLVQLSVILPSQKTTVSVALPKEPSIMAFTANPSSIGPGQPATLTWTTSGAASASIDNGVGANLGLSGSTSVRPTQTTTYTLAVTGPCGTATKQVTVTVSVTGCGRWQWVNPLPQGNVLRAVAFSPSAGYVGVGDRGTVLTTSGDLMAWTLRDPGSRSSLLDVIWTGSQFIAVGEEGAILTSPNGATWTAQVSGVAVVLRRIAIGNSRIVAVGDSGTILTSSTGTAWTKQNSGTSSALHSVAWNGSRFVAVGAGGIVRSSGDGTSWTAAASGATQDLLIVAAGGGRFVAIEGSYDAKLRTSADGVTWKEVAVAADLAGLSGVVWNGAAFVLAGGTWKAPSVSNGQQNPESIVISYPVLWRSTDGQSWSVLNKASGHGSSLSWTGREYVSLSGSKLGSSSDGLTWRWTDGGMVASLQSIAASSSRAVVGSFGSFGWPGTAFTSLDGTAWTALASGPVELAWGRDRFVGLSVRGLWVGRRPPAPNSVYSGTGLYDSADGLSWGIRKSTPSQEALHDVCWGGDRFLAIGHDMNLNSMITYVSTDGVNWIYNKVGSNWDPYAVTWGNNRFVAVGSGFSVVSTDGRAWTLSALSGGDSLLAVAWGANLFVAVGSGGVIWTSAEGSSWTKRSSPVSANLSDVIFANGSFVAVGAGGTILSSRDGISWYVETSPTNNPLSGVTWFKNSYIVVGSAGSILRASCPALGLASFPDVLRDPE